jgi:hypothetical protein
MILHVRVFGTKPTLDWELRNEYSSPRGTDVKKGRRAAAFPDA